MRIIILGVVLASSLATSALAGGCPPYADGSIGTTECHTGRVQDDQLEEAREEQFQERLHKCQEDCTGGLLVNGAVIYRIGHKVDHWTMSPARARRLYETSYAEVYMPNDSGYSEIATRFLVQTK